MVAGVAMLLSAAGSSASTTHPASVRRPHAVEVELLDRGRAPREALRLAVPVGTVQHLEMTQRTVASSRGQGAQRNTTTLEATQTLVEVDAGGNLHLRYAIDDLSVSGADEEAVQAAVAELRNLSAELVVSPRNEIVSSDVDLSGVTDPLVAEVLTQLTSQLEQLSQPFPGPPVGVGARWRTTTSLSVYNIDVRVDTTYTLRSHDGNTVELAIRLDQRAARQRAEIPGAPADAQATGRVRGRGVGRQTVDLALPVAVEASVTARATVSFQALLAGNLRSVALDLTQRFDQTAR